MKSLALLLLFPSIALADGNSIRGKVSINSPGDDPGPAVVYVTGFSAAPKSAKEPEVIQKNEHFEPTFLPIVQGQAIRFINKDSKAHNVFSTSEPRKFDLGTADSGAQTKVTFPTPGLVDVFCNIHPSMEMRILVLQNPAFTLAQQGAEYRISGIPDGKFKVFAWHPHGKPASKEVELKGGQTVTLDWALDANQTSTPHLNKYGRPYRDKQKY